MTILEVKLKYLLTLLLVVTLVTLTFLDFKKETDEPLTVQGSIMGTTYKVVTYGDNNSISKEIVPIINSFEKNWKVIIHLYKKYDQVVSNLKNIKLDNFDTYQSIEK